MTKFIDGPAAGQVLSIRRAPIFIRAVRSRTGEWDALDWPSDVPKQTESIHVYILVERPTYCHICIRGKGKGGSGFYPMAEYRHLDDPPDDEVRDHAAWQRWVDDRREYVPEHLLGDANG